MEPNRKDRLRALSKDDQSFKELQEIFEGMERRHQQDLNKLELLETAISSDYDSILITELDLEEPGPRIVYVNDGFCKMTGYSKEEVIGKTPRILQGPKTDREVLDRLKKCLSQGQSFFGKAINYRKDGTEFVNQWDVHPLTGPQGDITHWVSYQHDITQRKRAESQVMDTHLEFDELREEAHRTLVDVDKTGTIIKANKAFRELTGYDKAELKQIKIWEFFPEKLSNSLKSRFEEGKIIKNFTDRQFSGVMKHREGIPIQIEGRTKVFTINGEPLIRAEIKNISLQKRIIETLHRRNNDYSKIFKKTSEFAYKATIEDGEISFGYVSEDFPGFTGIPAARIIKDDRIGELIHQEDLQAARQHLQKVLDGQEDTCEYRVRYKTGEYIPVIDHAKPEWDANHKQILSVKGVISKK